MKRRKCGKDNIGLIFIIPTKSKNSCKTAFSQETYPAITPTMLMRERNKQVEGMKEVETSEEDIIGTLCAKSSSSRRRK